MKTTDNNTRNRYKTSSKVDAVKQISVSSEPKTRIAEILFITSFPPRVCGIATYSQDLITALETKFDKSFNISICPIETEDEIHQYSPNITSTLNIDSNSSFEKLEHNINSSTTIEIVLLQHEFGLFRNKETELIHFLKMLNKPVITVFHTVFPFPDTLVMEHVKNIVLLSDAVVVMTRNSAHSLSKEYGVQMEKINVIPHGTHLVAHSEKQILKQKHHFSKRKVLSTFGLMSSGKSIETSLNALPAIIAENPDVLFLIIGKTHPTVIKNEGEKYRNMLYNKVVELNLQNNVKFINQFLPLPELLEYLLLTDIYLFTSKDPNQAVSGTFAYALSCGCPIVSTPIPHAKEVIKHNTGVIVDFENSTQLAQAVNNLLQDDEYRTQCSQNALHTMAQTAWENSAISHARLFVKTSLQKIKLIYNLPPINLKHIQKMTTEFGIIQFANINHPDYNSGYTLDDNARALVAYCQHYQLTKEKEDVEYIQIYFEFIKYCLQPDNTFLNYVNLDKEFTRQNKEANLNDAHGRAIWALGFLLSIYSKLPNELVIEAEQLFSKALTHVTKIHSTRSISFIIKGLYYYDFYKVNAEHRSIMIELSDRLVQMYRHESVENWRWFESYLTYGNSIIPEALLCAYQTTKQTIYKDIAKESFDFLLSKTFHNNTMKIISNTKWLHAGEISKAKDVGGEQPIDVAYTIMALEKFINVFGDDNYSSYMKIAFGWFLGKNHLHQIVYNPSTGGCYDGLEDHYVNLNQGAESTVSYLMARLTVKQANSESNKNYTSFFNFKILKSIQ